MGSISHLRCLGLLLLSTLLVFRTESTLGSADAIDVARQPGIDREPEVLTFDDYFFRDMGISTLTMHVLSTITVHYLLTCDSEACGHSSCTLSPEERDALRWRRLVLLVPRVTTDGHQNWMDRRTENSPDRRPLSLVKFTHFFKREPLERALLNAGLSVLWTSKQIHFEYPQGAWEKIHLKGPSICPSLLARWRMNKGANLRNKYLAWSFPAMGIFSRAPKGNDGKSGAESAVTGYGSRGTSPGVETTDRVFELRRQLILALEPAKRLTGPRYALEVAMRERVLKYWREQMPSQPYYLDLVKILKTHRLPEFDAVYLRIEDDWKTSCELLGVRNCFSSLQHIRQRVSELIPDEKQRKVPIFLAGPSADQSNVIQEFRNIGIDVITKATLVPDIVKLYELHTNDLAVLEFWLCSQSRIFIGNALSSFSMLVSERRAYSAAERNIDLPSFVVNEGRAMDLCNQPSRQLCPTLQALFLDECLNSSDGFRECWQRIAGSEDMTKDREL